MASGVVDVAAVVVTSTEVVASGVVDVAVVVVSIGGGGVVSVPTVATTAVVSVESTGAEIVVVASIVVALGLDVLVVSVVTGASPIGVVVTTVESPGLTAVVFANSSADMVAVPIAHAMRRNKTLRSMLIPQMNLTFLIDVAFKTKPQVVNKLLCQV